MGNCGLVVAKTQDLQVLPTDVFPYVCMQSQSALGLLAPDLAPILSEECGPEPVQNGAVSSRCLCQQEDERSNKL